LHIRPFWGQFGNLAIIVHFASVGGSSVFPGTLSRRRGMMSTRVFVAASYVVGACASS